MSRFRILAAGAVFASIVIVGSLTVAGVAGASAIHVPSRIMDTRAGLGAAAGRAGPGQVIRLAAPAAALSAGATSLVVNLTATESSRAGHVTMWSCDDDKPTTSNLWGCVGVWFSGRWYVNNDAYLNEVGDSVRWHYDNTTWLNSNFING